MMNWEERAFLFERRAVLTDDLLATTAQLSACPWWRLIRMHYLMSRLDYFRNEIDHLDKALGGKPDRFPT